MEFCAGYMPAGLPTSCLTMAPRFDQLKMVDGARKPLGTINGISRTLYCVVFIYSEMLCFVQLNISIVTLGCRIAML